MARKRILKEYRSPFVLDPSKLRRLLAVASERLAQLDAKVVHKFHVQLSNEKVVETESLEDVLKLDNSRRSYIRKLSVISIFANTDVFVEFDDREPGVQIMTTSNDALTAADLMASTEEQVERTLQTGPLYRLAGARRHSREIIFLLLSTVAVMASTFTLAYKMAQNRPSHLERSMWLTDRDMDELRPVMEAGHKLTAEEMAIVERRQLANLMEARNNDRLPGLFFRVFENWRSWLIACPLLAVVVSLMYLVSACYPSSVFLWGDMEEWYERLLNRRRVIWQVVVVATLVGILSNLFVFGVTGYIKP